MQLPQILSDDEENMDTKEENEENEEFDPVVPEPTTTGEEESEPSCDLDRVGSFFQKELSAKALNVVPLCSETYDSVLNGRGAWQNSEKIKKMGLMAALENLADVLSNPQRIHRDKSGNERKLEVVSCHVHFYIILYSFYSILSTRSLPMPITEDMLMRNSATLSLRFTRKHLPNRMPPSSS